MQWDTTAHHWPNVWQSGEGDGAAWWGPCRPFHWSWWALDHSLSEKCGFYSTSSAYAVTIIIIYLISLILYPVRRVACLSPCAFYCFHLKLSLHLALQHPRDVPLWKWGARWKVSVVGSSRSRGQAAAGAEGCRQSQLAGCSAHPCFLALAPFLGV